MWYAQSTGDDRKKWRECYRGECGGRRADVTVRLLFILCSFFQSCVTVDLHAQTARLTVVWLKLCQKHAHTRYHLYRLRLRFGGTQFEKPLFPLEKPFRVRYSKNICVQLLFPRGGWAWFGGGPGRGRSGKGRRSGWVGAKIPRFFSSRTSCCFCFSNFRHISWNCGGQAIAEVRFFSTVSAATPQRGRIRVFADRSHAVAIPPSCNTFFVRG